jgi:hypothetical protein
MGGASGLSSHHAFSRSVSAAVSHDIGGGSNNEFKKSTPLTARRTTLERNIGGGANGTGLPTPSALPRRQSSGIPMIGSGGPRRQSGATAGDGLGEMRPPSSKGRKLSGVGESY